MSKRKTANNRQNAFLQRISSLSMEKFIEEVLQQRFPLNNNWSNNNKTHLPRLHGRVLHMQALFIHVVNRGGFHKVTSDDDWHSIAELMHLPISCVHIENNLRAIYQNYLLDFEEKYSDALGLKTFFCDSEILLSGDEYGSVGGSQSKRSAMDVFNNEPFRSNSSHYYDVTKVFHQRNNQILSDNVRNPTELNHLYLSLLSGLPNEVDFALNNLLLISQSSDQIRFALTGYLLEILCCLVGIVDPENGSNCEFYANWIDLTQRKYTQFWEFSSSHNDGAFFLNANIMCDPGFVLPTLEPIDAHNTSAGLDSFCDAFLQSSSTSSSSSSSSLLSLSPSSLSPPSLSSNDSSTITSTIKIPNNNNNNDEENNGRVEKYSVEYQHVYTITSILYNVCTGDVNAKTILRDLYSSDRGAGSGGVTSSMSNLIALSQSPQAIRFLFLLCYSKFSTLRRFGLELLSMVRFRLTEQEDNYSPIARLTTRLLQSLIFQGDRFALMKGMQMLSLQSTLLDNQRILDDCHFIPMEILTFILQCLFMDDFRLCLSALECLRTLSLNLHDLFANYPFYAFLVKLLMNYLTRGEFQWSPRASAGVRIHSIRLPGFIQQQQHQQQQLHHLHQQSQFHHNSSLSSSSSGGHLHSRLSSSHHFPSPSVTQSSSFARPPPSMVNNNYNMINNSSSNNNNIINKQNHFYSTSTSFSSSASSSTSSSLPINQHRQQQHLTTILPKNNNYQQHSAASIVAGGNNHNLSLHPSIPTTTSSIQFSAPLPPKPKVPIVNQVDCSQQIVTAITSPPPQTNLSNGDICNTKINGEKESYDPISSPPPNSILRDDRLVMPPPLSPATRMPQLRQFAIEWLRENWQCTTSTNDTTDSSSDNLSTNCSWGISRRDLQQKMHAAMHNGMSKIGIPLGSEVAPPSSKWVHAFVLEVFPHVRKSIKKKNGQIEVIYYGLKQMTPIQKCEEDEKQMLTTTNVAQPTTTTVAITMKTDDFLCNGDGKHDDEEMKKEGNDNGKSENQEEKTIENEEEKKQVDKMEIEKFEIIKESPAPVVINGLRLVNGKCPVEKLELNGKDCKSKTVKEEDEESANDSDSLTSPPPPVSSFTPQPSPPAAAVVGVVEQTQSSTSNLPVPSAPPVPHLIPPPTSCSLRKSPVDGFTSNSSGGSTLYAILNSSNREDNSSSNNDNNNQNVTAPCVLTIVCRWRNCFHRLASYGELRCHIYDTHICPLLAGNYWSPCLWQSTLPFDHSDSQPHLNDDQKACHLSRGPLSLFTHIVSCHFHDCFAHQPPPGAAPPLPLLPDHPLPTGIVASGMNIVKSPSSTAALRLPPQQLPHPPPSPTSSIIPSVVLGYGVGTGDNKEYPLTKHIRCTAALILRSLTSRHLHYAQELLKDEESLVTIAFSEQDCAGFVAECLTNARQLVAPPPLPPSSSSVLK